MSEQAKGLLRDPDTSAVALIPAARALLGDFVTWEPESIWLELEHHGVDVPTSNRARMMAALTLHLVPSFYWDGIVFEKTAIAFDGVTPNADTLEEASPARLAWATVEAGWILRLAKDPPREFDSEPRAYAGVILHRAGFVLAPEQLSFGQKALDRENFHGALREEVKSRWASVDKAHLEALSLGETPVDVQIARLAAVELHVRDKQAKAQRDLAKVS